MKMVTIDEAIAHARKAAQEKYNEGFLCHANPNDDELDNCIDCAKEHEQLAEWLEELKEYKQLEEQGLLLELPCKVGDTVYVKMQSGEYAEAEVRDFTYFLTCGFCIVVTSDKFGKRNISLSEFGKTVFLAQAEAEEVLKRMEREE